MNEKALENSIECVKYRTKQEYSHFQEFVDNLPYIMMIFLGAVILFMVINISFWGWICLVADHRLCGPHLRLWLRRARLDPPADNGRHRP